MSSQAWSKRDHITARAVNAVRFPRSLHSASATCLTHVHDQITPCSFSNGIRSKKECRKKQPSPSRAQRTLRLVAALTTASSLPELASNIRRPDRHTTIRSAAVILIMCLACEQVPTHHHSLLLRRACSADEVPYLAQADAGAAVVEDAGTHRPSRAQKCSGRFGRGLTQPCTRYVEQRVQAMPRGRLRGSVDSAALATQTRAASLRRPWRLASVVVPTVRCSPTP
jgi:hypothetical protein